MICKFKKMKMITNPNLSSMTAIEQVQISLSKSRALILSDDGVMVRRVQPIMVVDMTEVEERTVMVENIPIRPAATVESLTAQFSQFGMGALAAQLAQLAA